MALVVALSPDPILQFFADDGTFLVGGQLFTTVGGIPYPTYADSQGLIQHANPIILNSRGEIATSSGQSAQLYLIPGVTYTFALFDAQSNPIDTPTSIQGIPTNAQIIGLIDSTVTATFIGQEIFPLTAAEQSAGVTPTNYSVPDLTAARYGVMADGVTDDTVAWNAAILVAAQTVSGATGATVDASRLTGLTNVSSQIVLPNRVRIKGPNCSGLIFTAQPLHPGPFMFYANNGTTAMFDSILEDLFIDCNNVAGLGGIRTDAWQENSGLRSVGIKNFTTYGVHFVNVNAGGQSTCEIEQVQLFAASAGATAGIRVDQISSIGAFQLHVRDTIIAAGGTPNTMARGIDMVNDSLLVENCHFEDCTDAIYLDGVGNHTVINSSGGSTTGTVVHIASTFTGRATMEGCQRNGSANFVKNDVTGETLTSPDLAMYVYPSIKTQNTAVAKCVFDGTGGATIVPMAGSFNVTNISHPSAGRYTVNMTLPISFGNVVAGFSSNIGTASKVEWVSLIGAGSFSLNINVAGTPTDSNEIKVWAF